MSVYIRWFNADKKYPYFLGVCRITPDEELIKTLSKYMETSNETVFLKECLKEFFDDIFDFPNSRFIQKADISVRSFSIQKTLTGEWNINLWFGTIDPVKSLTDRFDTNIKLITTPKDNPPSNKNFNMKVPVYGWDLPRTIHAVSGSDIALLILIRYFQVCSNEEHEQLLKGGCLWRMMQYQDSPDSNPYAYVYLRPIDQCLPEHQKVFNSCPKDYLPAEITAQRGHFLWIRRSSWEKKQVKFEDLLEVD